MIINLKEDKPFFETILEYSTHSQHNWAIPFFKNCTRFIINTDEYFSWAGDCDFEKSNGVVDCTIPFDKFWCEFFISHKRSAIRNKLGNFLILGLGFDLEKGSCIALVGNPKEETVDLISFSISKQFEVMTDNPIGIASNICTNIRAIGIPHHTDSSSLLPSQFGVYFAFLLVSMYFMAMNRVKANTGTTTVADKIVANTSKSFCFWATIP